MEVNTNSEGVQPMDTSPDVVDVELDLPLLSDLGTDTICLKSNIDPTISSVVHVESLDLSSTLAACYEDSRVPNPKTLSPEQLAEYNVIRLPEVEEVIHTQRLFDLFAKWLDYHRLHQEEHLKFKNESCEKIGDWDKQFLDEIGEDHDTLFSMLLLANHIDCKYLLNLCCKHIARQIIDKDPEEIKKHFQLNPLEPVEGDDESSQKKSKSTPKEPGANSASTETSNNNNE